MHPTPIRTVPLLHGLLAVLLAGFLALPVAAAVKVSKPRPKVSRSKISAKGKSVPKLLLDDEDTGNRPSRTSAPGRSGARSLQVGQVIFSRGAQVVAEIDGGAVDNEYLVVFDAGFRRRGAAVVVKALKGNTYLLRGVGGTPSEGDRLGRESERQAVARVLRQKDAAGYRAFLARFPDSTYKDRVARELFRLQMKAEFPTRPGSSVAGTLNLAETVSHPVPMEDVQVVLDRFVVAVTAVGGEYRIDGIPLPEVPVTVKLRIKDAKFRDAGAVTVDLPAARSVEVEEALPVKLTPTVLSGTVLDEAGQPLAGAEVWTAPYTLEFLTGDDGTFEISRIKNLDDPGAADRPLFGGEFEVYARRSGYSVERVAVAAESFVSNPVPVLRLAPQDTRNEDVPELALTLREHLRIDPSLLAGSAGAGPMLNP